MYLNRTFIHDVHPPLAKLLIALSQHLAGHNGTFDFPAGTPYPDYVNIAWMRAQIAIFGSLLAPLAYLTCRALDMSRAGSILAAVFVIFDNALCLMSRLMVLDGPLLLFTALVLFCLVKFSNESRSFEKMWWVWLASLGVSLGLALSAKWVGAFSVALVGCWVVGDLISMLRTHTSWPRYAWHWVARALALIALPLVVYMLAFRVHFHMQTEKSYGEHMMPVRFQATLRGNRYNTQPYDVPYGSIAKIQSAGRAWESSANIISKKRFHGDPAPQPVGLNASNIGFDWWRIKHAVGEDVDYDHGPLEYIHDQDTVTLVHDHTHKHLFVDSRHAPYQVLAVQAENATYGYLSRDANWVIEMAGQAHMGSNDSHLLHPLNTEFRLRHAATGCVLSLSDRRLTGTEDVGQLIVCEAEASALWRVEFNVDLRVGFDGNSAQKFRPREFFADLVRLNSVMAQSNSALVPDADKYNHLESAPWTWPLMLYPMRIGDWQKSEMKHYEIGNPLLWWTVALVCFAYPLQALWWGAAMRRGHLVGRRWLRTRFLWLGWAWHYLPFFAMGRVTYIHHYLPALYFGLLLVAEQVDCVLAVVASGPRRVVLASAIAAAVAYVFYLFSPFTFGWSYPPRDLAYLQWLPTWNIFEDKYDIE
ncbi:Protein O-mannosyltransferase 2 [Linderina pennispora]|nr:Protein O-mannosyltransferase 2 [Linderina pennispora]